MARDLNVDQIKKLWILDLIIQTGSFKSAALQAKVTPSAISQTVTALESSFGKSLLIRDRNSITPTQEALHILQVIRPAFAAFDQLKDLNNLPVPKVSWINFGTYESIAVDILPGLISTLRSKLPSARLGLRVARTNQLLSMVRKAELCSALITEVDELDRFYKKTVYTDRLGLYIAKKQALTQLGWSALDKLGLGSLSAGKEGFPRYFMKYMKQLDISKPLVLCESFETLRAAAVAGSIVSVLPERVAKRSDDLIELIPPKSMKETGQHNLIVISQLRCDREETDFISEEVRKILNSGDAYR
jgi:DNA-binding transcriptional LysR family regulator